MTQYSISAEDRLKFREDGFFVLKNVIDPAFLELLQTCCDAAFSENGKRKLSRRQLQRPEFIKFPHQPYPELNRFLDSPLLAEICRATIGKNAYLYYDQFVIKQARTGGAISWHQDSNYVGIPHRPYVNCWCALDDVSVRNGTVRLLSYTLAGSRDLLPELWDEQGRNLYRSKHRGTPVTVSAGSIVVFSSLVFHRSGNNTTTHPRRAYIIQFSPDPILIPGTKKPQWLARPFLRQNKIVPYKSK